MKPQNCPVCEVHSEAIRWACGGWKVICRSAVCSFEGPLRRLKQEAIAAWNRLRYVEEGK